MWDGHALSLAAWCSRRLLAGWSPVSLTRAARTQRHLGRCPTASLGLGRRRVLVCRWVAATAAGHAVGHLGCPLGKQRRRERERSAGAARCEWREWTTLFRGVHIRSDPQSTTVLEPGKANCHESESGDLHAPSAYCSCFGQVIRANSPRYPPPEKLHAALRAAAGAKMHRSTPAQH